MPMKAALLIPAIFPSSLSLLLLLFVFSLLLDALGDEDGFGEVLVGLGFPVSFGNEEVARDVANEVWGAALGFSPSSTD